MCTAGKRVSIQYNKTVREYTRIEMPPKEEFTAGEMEMVMSVFKQYETGLREACIDVKVDILKWFIRWK